MGVHKRQRDVDELKKRSINKSSCIIIALGAFFLGLFFGNAVTMLYIGQQGQREALTTTSGSTESAPHTANPAALAKLEGEAAANPTNADAWIKLGNFCFDHDLPGKAITAYERALELSPMDIGVWSDLGVMYRRTKQFEKAIDAFGHAAKLDTTHVTARFNMGIVYLYDLNNKAEAIRAWKQVLAIDPNAVTPSGQKVSKLVEDLEK